MRYIHVLLTYLLTYNYMYIALGYYDVDHASFVCWLVGWFVLNVCCAFSKSPSPIFKKFGRDVQYLCRMSILILTCDTDSDFCICQN